MREDTTEEKLKKSREEIEKGLKDILVKQLSLDKETIDKITSETSFIEDLRADSLDALEIIMGIQDAYGMEISDEDAEKIQTYGAAVDYITSHNKKPLEPAQD